MSSTSKRSRPLSPFLFGANGFLYRWQYTMALSILHRAMGCALSVGFILLVYWLVAAAVGEEEYSRATAIFAHPVTTVLLVAFTFAFFYHLMNGVRHLFWDVGLGFEKKVARRSGWSVFIGAIVVTAIFWLYAGGVIR